MTQSISQHNFIKGKVSHCRTEDDYMATFLDAVTLEDWKEVVGGALTAAKSGDAQARAWLAHYLVGKPQGTAPTPLTVVVQQLSGTNALINSLAAPVIKKKEYPILCGDDEGRDQIKSMIAEELKEKVQESS